MNSIGIFCFRKLSVLYLSLHFSYFATSLSLNMKRAIDALQETNSQGKFIRTPSVFRDIISSDNVNYKPAFGRYHLYISYACPWANRALAVLNMKGLIANGCVGFTGHNI